MNGKNAIESTRPVLDPQQVPQTITQQGDADVSLIRPRRESRTSAVLYLTHPNQLVLDSSEEPQYRNQDRGGEHDSDETDQTLQSKGRLRSPAGQVRKLQ